MIRMYRGDSETLRVVLKKNNEYIPLEEGDIVYFSIKKYIDDQEYVLQKVETSFSEGEAIIEIDPEDTKNLPLGKYVYDVQLTTRHDRVITLKVDSFILIGEVTHD